MQMYLGLHFKMLNLKDKPKTEDQKKIVPLEKYNTQVKSIPWLTRQPQ